MGNILRWKGELCDGEIHMTAREYSEHRLKELDEQMRQRLRKIAGNPILTRETQEAIRHAMWAIDENAWLKKTIGELRETIDNMKKRNGMK